MKINKVCPTCQKEFEAKRRDKTYCSRLCFRRNPVNAKRYSDRTNIYQAKIARKPWRRFAKLKHKCSHEKRELSINLEQYINLISQPCAYCSKDMINETGVGLDRIDNNLGYITTNVIPCCGSCNQIRNVHLTHDEMKVAMGAVVKFRNIGEP